MPDLNFMDRRGLTGLTLYSLSLSVPSSVKSLSSTGRALSRKGPATLWGMMNVSPSR